MELDLKKAKKNIRDRGNRPLMHSIWGEKEQKAIFKATRHHIFMHSMFLFLLNVAGRTQDKFSVSPAVLLNAIQKKEPFMLEKKKTAVDHPAKIDERVAPTIETFAKI